MPSSAINLSFIIREIGDEPAIICEMLQTFADVLHEYDAEMERALRLSDIQSIITATHKIKPGLKMFGLQHAYQLALEIEQACRHSASKQSLSALFSRLKHQLPAIQSDIQLLISNRQSPT